TRDRPGPLADAISVVAGFDDPSAIAGARGDDSDVMRPYDHGADLRAAGSASTNRTKRLDGPLLSGRSKRTCGDRSGGAARTGAGRPDDTHSGASSRDVRTAG